MVNKFLSKGQKLLSSPQTSILSAATIIMLMVVVSRVLGLVRQRALAHFFAPDELSLFFAAFRLPDLVFEVLVFGTFASAFIPVFTRSLKKSRKEAWQVASTITNIGLLIFVVFALLVIVFSPHLYGVIAPGYSAKEQETIVNLARILFLAQGFFVVSYVLTAVLESSRRFLVPALAPLFYNVGIILGTVFLSSRMHLLAPTFGVLIGAGAHLLVQLPLAWRLGYRLSFSIKLNADVKKIGRLALPRIIEVSFLQVAKTVELFLSSLISTASYTYFTFGNTIQLLPVGLFGIAIAKASLPTLARQSDNLDDFRRTLFSALYQIVFLVLPFAVTLFVLRIPIVRLIFGTDIFTWEATVQTGMVVSAFAVGIVFQAAAALLARAFYALHDTKTPVIISIISISINICFAFIFTKTLGIPAWGLAAALSMGSFFYAVILFFLINKKIGEKLDLAKVLPFAKSLVASLGAGSVMFILLKIFDRSVWIKQLSFLGRIDGVENLPFQGFVLDTRYTGNLLILTIFVSAVGASVYILLSYLFKSKEMWYFFHVIKRLFVSKRVEPIPAKEQESVTPPPTETP